MGDGFDVRGDLGRSGVCVFHHRRVLQNDRRLEGRQSHANRNCVGCDRDGQMVPGANLARASLPQRRRKPRWIQLVATTPRDYGGVVMVRRQQAADRAVRLKLRSPGRGCVLGHGKPLSNSSWPKSHKQSFH